jgi:hypothetical protein
MSRRVPVDHEEPVSAHFALTKAVGRAAIGLREVAGSSSDANGGGRRFLDKTEPL